MAQCIHQTQKLLNLTRYFLDRKVHYKVINALEGYSRCKYQLPGKL